MDKVIRQESVSTKSEHYRQRMQRGTRTHDIPKGGKDWRNKCEKRRACSGRKYCYFIHPLNKRKKAFVQAQQWIINYILEDEDL